MSEPEAAPVEGQEDLKAKLDRLTLLYGLNRDFNATLDVAELMPKVFEKVLTAADAEAGSFWLWDEERKVITCENAFGPGSESVKGLELPKGTGVVGWVINMKKPTIVKDATADKRFAGKKDEKSGFVTKSMICVPLVASTGVLGAIQVLNKKGDTGQFSDEDLELCRVLADNAAMALVNARSFENEKKAKERIQVFNEFNKAQSTTLELDKLLDIILKRVVAILDAMAGSVWLREGQELACKVAAGPTGGKLKGVKVGVGTGIVGSVVSKKTPMIVEDTSKSELFSGKVDDATGFKTKSLITVPLIHQDEAIGAIQIINKKHQDDLFTKEDMELLSSLAGLSTSAIKNATLYEVERKAKDLSTLLEISKDVSSNLDIDSVLVTVVNLTNQVVPYDRAAMFVKNENKFDLKAVSGVTKIDMNDPVMKALDNAVDGLDKDLYIPDAEAYLAESGGAAAVKEYLKAAGVAAFYARVLADDQGALAMMTMESKNKNFIPPAQMEMITLLANQITVSLRNAELYKSVPLFSSLGQSAVGKRPLVAAAIGLAVLAGLGALLTIPKIEHQIAGDIEIIPIVKYKIYAKESGLLEKVQFQEGDMIKAGDLFAELSVLDMEQERSKLTTKRELARQAYLRAIGLSNMAEARMKESEIAQAERELANLASKMNNTKVISPYEGQVLTKDLSQKVGENVSRGSIVGEVVDLGELQVKFLVPQEQIRYIQAGQPVHFKVSAYPARAFDVKIDRIGLDAEPVESQIFYNAYATISNADRALRAGMSGRGRIHAGKWRPLDRLLEQPTHWFRMTWVW
ncbi:GAF domain-containing protein [bacterium]|nr:GAF domain-containing protein [bacterium]